MNIKAHMAMVMNLDKCIGCHTCSVTCKNVWTNRRGAEYMWFNNVETKPGLGYPKQWENQDKWHGGWELDKKKRLRLKSGSKLQKLANIFFNPHLPTIDDYYDPWTYDYDKLTSSGDSKHQPVARPISQITGKDMQLEWGPNWEDDLAGAPENAPGDPNFAGCDENSIKLEYEQAFMMYLPRICNHCINTTCMASCPSGSIYKRDEDGIVLIDQERCRGWRMCVSGCPYKKVFFNWNTGKAEKCTFCYPRIEAGMPTVCSETCVGRIRYLGLLLYDADRIEEIAATENEHDLIDAQRSMFLDPHDPTVQELARKAGIAEDWLEAAQRSPVYKLVMEHQVALPLHPEYRTLPMVWYVPPLSPVMNAIEGEGSESVSDEIFPAIDSLRIPIQYLANLLAAGDQERIRSILKKLAAMRSYMRAKEYLGASSDSDTNTEIEELYRLLAIAKYKDRFVVPKRHGEIGRAPELDQGSCGLSFAGGPGPCISDSCGSVSNDPQESLVDTVREEEFEGLKVNFVEVAIGKEKLRGELG